MAEWNGLSHRGRRIRSLRTPLGRTGLIVPEYNDEGDEIIRIADRFALQQSWWVASEIARRHGSLWISRVEDEDFHGLLIVHSGPVGSRTQFDLPQGAGWMNAIEEFERLDWLDILQADDPHAAVKRIEQGAGFGTPETVAATNRLTVAYRVAAAILAAKVDDPHSWQILQAPLVTSPEQRDETLATLAQFESTAPWVDYAWQDIAELYEQAAILDTTPYWHEPFWLVLRDLEPVLVLDESGNAHLADGVMLDLLSLYRGVGRDIAAVAGVVLMEPNMAHKVARMIDLEEPGGL